MTRSRVRKVTLFTLLVGLILLPVAWVSMQPQPWEAEVIDGADRSRLVTACRRLMSNVGREDSLSWGYGASPNSVPLPSEVAALKPFWTVAGRDQVRFGWPDSENAPTLYRGFIIYAEGTEPPGSVVSGDQPFYRARKVADGFWAFEKRGDQ